MPSDVENFEYNLTAGRTLWLSVLSVFMLVNYISYAITIGLWMTIETSFHYGMYALIHLILFGTVCAFIPRSTEYREAKDVKSTGTRQARMAQQGGHTLMLVYFVGQAPLAELYRLVNGLSGAAIGLYLDALNMHSSGVAMFKCLITWWAVNSLQVLKNAIETGASTAAGVIKDVVDNVDNSEVMATLGLDAMASPVSVHTIDWIITISYISFAIAAISFLLCNITHVSVTTDASTQFNRKNGIKSQ